MKQKKTMIAVFAGVAVLSVAAMAWGFKDRGHQYAGTDGYRTDTVPGQNKNRDKKIRDLDDAVAELERAQAELGKTMKIDMEKMQKELAESMKKLDAGKIRLQIEQSLREVDMEKIEKEIKEAMIKAEKELAQVDMEKIRMEIKESLAAIDTEKIKKELEKIKKIDLSKMEEEMVKARKEMEEIAPKLEKELEKAKVELEKAKKELEELKEFVDGLNRDGLIDKDKDYTIELKKDKLFINGKEQPQEVYNKYRKYLDGKKDFKIEKSEDDFDVNMDHDGVIRL